MSNSRKIEYKGPSWNSVRKKLKPLFLEAGVTWCELSWEGCDWPKTKTFAHSMRRVYLETKEDMEDVILACQTCHGKLDAKEHEDTYNIVQAAKLKRQVPVRSAFERKRKK